MAEESRQSPRLGVAAASLGLSAAVGVAATLLVATLATAQGPDLAVPRAPLSTLGSTAIDGLAALMRVSADRSSDLAVPASLAD